jgi:hypothetical protein
MIIFRKFFNIIFAGLLLASPAVVVGQNQTDSNTDLKFPIKKYDIDSYQDVDKPSPMDTKLPENVRTAIEYDVNSGNYVFRTYVGDMEVSTPYMMTGKEYLEYSARQDLMKYWKEKNASDPADNEDKFSLSDIKFSLGPADKIFGPGGVQLKTQGSAELIFGVKHNKVDNPSYTEQARSVFTPEFDMKIQMNINATVGDKVNFGMNYNTESTFDYDQKMVKLGFQGKEDDIIQDLQAGNVSMQLNSSLISGSSALFGVRSDLKFGKLRVSALVSQQNSESKTVSAKGGAQTTEFEINVDDYDENRHFFLSQFFRDRYESALSTLPMISSGINIERIEVWITNKRANYDQSRNIVAFMDLGETENINNTILWQPTDYNDILPHNKANNLYDIVRGLPDSRDIQQVNSVLVSRGLSGGEDFEKIESARKLEATEYTVNTSLGYISLRNTLNPDEVVCVAFEYTYGGKTYNVGEFSTGTIDPPKALFVKLLKGTVQSPELKIWDLMMKNVYTIGGKSNYSATQMQPDNFKLNVVYRNDSVGTEMQYITEGDIANKLLLKVMNLDRLDARQNVNPDGRFDYVENVTVQSNYGRIIFPVLEPFGNHLRKMIKNDAIADKYVFQELYDSTLVSVRELSEKNKFRIKGEYKGTKGMEMDLGAWNIPRGSVTVTAGGVQLTENVDYTVDYSMGRVTIINPQIAESGGNIEVKLENQSTFSMQRKTLLGTHLEYEFSKNFTLGGTWMHLSEMPLTTKVNTGNEPISNTIWGLNTSWRGESQLLTKLIDKLPFVNATAPSTMAINAEFAQLIPGHSKVIGRTGYAYIDDFESTKTSYDIHHPHFWKLASTPSNSSGKAMFPEATSFGIDYGMNRALLAWYSVDPILNSPNPGRTTPVNLRNNVESQSNHDTRDVLIREVFPNKNYLLTERAVLNIMNLSFYPEERGPYNLDTEGMGEDGKLLNPRKRWGGIMRRTDNSDFETANIEHIEFWMMDPYISDKDGTKKGGDLYFNLGDISEDILKDGKKFFENGLPADGDETKVETSVWGRIPKTQSTVIAFDNGARDKQDVGLNGLSTADEFLFPTYADYLERLKNKVSPTTLVEMQNDRFSPLNDPSGDNYGFYKSTNYDDEEADILTRYKRYNGTEGNSPDESKVDEIYSTTATSQPDTEDMNNDNTLNDYENYYQYRVAIHRDSMRVGLNYIADSYTSKVRLANGDEEMVTWYQFKIPIREYSDRIGNIRNFKSIRFVRMFMTNFEQEHTLRFATLELVRGEWRSYSKNLFEAAQPPVAQAKLIVQAINIEENSDKSPVNYVLPPGITRQTDPGQTQILQLNEQSMLMRVSDLSPGEAKAIYKNTAYDMRNYKRLQMFVHAEKLKEDLSNLTDGELTCFIRLGSDMVNNYYEYEIPLTLTPEGIYSNESDADRARVWLPDNMFDFPFSVLTDAKLKRNKSKQDGSFISDKTPYYHNDRNKIRVVGNPSLSNVENIMIGIRNISGDVKSGEVWVNELRMSEFNEDGGWAAMGNLALGLSDIGNINVSGRVETAGYGSIESNVMNRRLDDLYQFNFATSMELGRFLPEKAQVQLPAYFSYTNETFKPKYNPLDQDIELSSSLESLESKSARDTLLNNSQFVTTTKSFNISSAKVNIRSKKPQFYDPANVTVAYSYSERDERTPDTESNMIKQQRASLNYAFSFNPKPVEPFKEVKVLNNPAFKIVKDFNFNYMPTSLSFNTDMNRAFSQLKLRDLAGSTGMNDFDLSFSNDFMWNKDFNIQWDLSRALKFSLQTAMNSNIYEGNKLPEIGKENYELWRDTVWSSIKKLGTPYTYQQVFSASWQIPINKLPMFDWISTTNVNYTSTYSWNRTAQPLTGGNIGNVASTIGAFSADAGLKFETLYNKSKYLKEVNTRFGNTNKSNNVRQFQPKSFKQVITLERGKKQGIDHRLASEKFSLVATDKSGKPLKIKYKITNMNSIEIIPRFDADSVQITMESIDPNVRTPLQNIADYSARTLMMLRSANGSYRRTSSMVMPGFLPEPGFLGQRKYNDAFAPGLGFVFGFFDDNTIFDAGRKGWLYTYNEETSVVTPANTAMTEDLELKVDLEPIAGFKISLNAKTYRADNTTIQYMFEGMPRTFNGSFNMTQIAIGTAFKKIGTADRNYHSEIFDKFLENREIMVHRMEDRLRNTRYPTTGFFAQGESGYGFSDKPFDPENGTYGLNSADVLIPAFFATYTGRDVKTTDTNPFLSLLSLLPNWQVSYDGLSKLPWFKEKFKTVSLNHRYNCAYNVANYTSYSGWVAQGNSQSLGFIRDVETGNPLPSSPYDIATVTISESFAPLIGVNVVMQNNITAKAEYKKMRDLSLNLSSTQLIEMSADEYVIGFGYVVKNFDVILRMKNNQQTKVNNDLKFSVDLSYKDEKSLLRKIDENITQASNGMERMSIKVMADYVFSSKVNIQAFFDHQASTPLVSTSFPVTSTNFGVSFKIMLTR